MTAWIQISDDEAQLVQSALYEYIGQRGRTVQEYIDRRYPVGIYSDDFRAQKVKDVQARLVKAEALRDRIGNLNNWEE